MATVGNKTKTLLRHDLARAQEDITAVDDGFITPIRIVARRTENEGRTGLN